MTNRLTRLESEQAFFKDLQSVVRRHTEIRKGGFTAPRVAVYKKKNTFAMIIETDSRIPEIAPKYGYVDLDVIADIYKKEIKEEKINERC